MKFYLNNKKITRKTAEEKFGKENMARKVKEAKDAHAEEPEELIQWYMGREGMLTIEF